MSHNIKKGSLIVVAALAAVLCLGTTAKAAWKSFDAHFPPWQVAVEVQSGSKASSTFTACVSVNSTSPYGGRFFLVRTQNDHTVSSIVPITQGNSRTLAYTADGSASWGGSVELWGTQYGFGSHFDDNCQGYVEFNYG